MDLSEALAMSDIELMDVWWTAMGDDWAIPDWAPRKFLEELETRRD